MTGWRPSGPSGAGRVSQEALDDAKTKEGWASGSCKRSGCWSRCGLVLRPQLPACEWIRLLVLMPPKKQRSFAKVVLLAGPPRQPWLVSRATLGRKGFPAHPALGASGQKAISFPRARQCLERCVFLMAGRKRTPSWAGHLRPASCLLGCRRSASATCLHG